MLIENPRSFGEGERAVVAQKGQDVSDLDGVLRYAVHHQSCACLACHGYDPNSVKGQIISGELAPGGTPDQNTIPGDATTTATLTPGSFVDEFINSATDSDWFRIELTAGETYVFTTYLPPGGLPDSILTVRDATDEEIRAGGPVAAEAEIDPSLTRPI